MPPRVKSKSTTAKKSTKKKQRTSSGSSFSYLWYIVMIVAVSFVSASFLMMSRSENDSTQRSKKLYEDLKHKLDEVAPPVEKSIINDHINRVTMQNKSSLVASPIFRRPTRAPVVKPMGALDYHFIHIPKCGGTSMTAILRDMACHIDSIRNRDCCTNPGFCDWHAMRRCTAIKGCTDHFPNRQHIFKKHVPSITLTRDPVSRLISAWFYRGHTPNNDFFQVRPYFKEIFQGLRPKVKYEEYIEMPEYQNIQTRMLGADSFPYRNITIDDEVFNAAVEALDNIVFVGIQEAYDLSVKLLLREMNMDYLKVSIEKERDMGDKRTTIAKNKLKANKKLMERTRVVNSYDVKLYNLALQKFCKMLMQYPDLAVELQETKVRCPEIP